MEGCEFNPEDTKGSLRGRFDAYCKQVIYHGTYNTVRKQMQYLFRRWGGDNADPDEVAKEGFEEDTEVVTISVGNHEVKLHDAELAQAVLTLQARKREILLLSEIIGYSLGEIASELGIEYETVKSTKSKAIRDLRKEVQRRNEE